MATTGFGQEEAGLGGDDVTLRGRVDLAQTAQLFQPAQAAKRPTYDQEERKTHRRRSNPHPSSAKRLQGRPRSDGVRTDGKNAWGISVQQECGPWVSGSHLSRCFTVRFFPSPFFFFCCFVLCLWRTHGAVITLLKYLYIYSNHSLWSLASPGVFLSWCAGAESTVFTVIIQLESFVPQNDNRKDSKENPEAPAHSQTHQTGVIFDIKKKLHFSSNPYWC